MSSELALGLGTGVLFGILLQRGLVLRFEKQMGALLFRDMTIMKFMLSAVIVGMAGLQILMEFGLAKHSLKATIIGANVIGGLLFGAGWALFGYCPGTSVGALAEGRWHAAWGILGMLAGAMLFAEIYGFLKGTVLTWGNFGKIALPQALNVSPWLIIPLFILFGLSLFWFFERKGL